MKKASHEIVLVSLLSIVISACVPSRYHMGFHQLSEEQKKQHFSPVSNKADHLVGEVEHQFIDRIVKADVSSLRELFAPRLSSQLTGDVIKDIESEVAAYEFDGRYEAIVVYDGPKIMWDEGVGKAPFDFYDYVGGAYQVSGKTNAIIEVYLTQVDSKVLVCGFRIAPIRSGSSDRAPLFFLAPESIDKAHLRGRGYRVIR